MLTMDCPEGLFEDITVECLTNEGNEANEQTVPEELPYPVERGFTPQDEDGVNWVMSHIAECRAKAALVREQSAKIIKAAEDEAKWFEMRYSADLEAFAKSRLTGKKSKSFDLLYGRLGFRTSPAQIKVEDADAALEWAKSNLPTAVKVVETVNLSILKDGLEIGGDGQTVVASDTGEVMPGFVRVEPAAEKFYVK